MKEIKDIIATLRKPLEFASKDGFAHINNIRGLDTLGEKLLREAVDSRLDERTKGILERISRLFSGFDTMDAGARKEAVRRASALLNLIASGAGVRQAPVRAFGTAPVNVEEAASRLEEIKKPLEYVKGIGPKLAERLGKKGLSTVEDLLYYLPIRYEDRSQRRKIRELAPGAGATVVVEVLAAGEVRYGRRRVYEVATGDSTGILKLKWFNYRPSYMKRFSPGRRFTVYGTVGAFGHQLEMIHPDTEIYEEGEGAEGVPEEAAGLVPVYSQIDTMHQKTIRKFVSSAVEEYAAREVGGVPDEVLSAHGMMGIAEAVAEAHRPGSMERAELARKSLAFDELFMLEVGLALKKSGVEEEEGLSLYAPDGGRGLERGLRKLLPFALTGAQERVLHEIKADMRGPHPMNRLIQGDVGSGKTVVSLVAALRAIDAGYQAAIMAPTEILAEQHYLTTHRYADTLGVRTLLLTGNLTRAERRKALDAIRAGEADLVIGTHAIIQKDVEFRALGLAVVDEQHRFGVLQRSELRKKGPGGVSPDQLIMTATPIPRTMSMTVFGDLDVSIIDELPPGRKPVATRILREDQRQEAYATIADEIRKGAQAYIVYPLVEESEELSLRDATNMKEHLERDVFGEFTVGLIHGRMKSAEKEEVMASFKSGSVDILVATTVIEVGVDVPNASVMLIEHAERFGLAQLHQLRGRVGRGERKSVCLLLAQWTRSEETYRRLKVMERTEDGFQIAEEDLKIRGPGDFIGTRQSGFPEFRITGALGDLELLKTAREEAFRFVEDHPGLRGAGPVKEVLKARWAGRLELAEVG